MARDILSEYGPDTPKPQERSMSKNGPVDDKPLRYSEPCGPIGIGHRGPGLGGTNLGNCGTQGNYDANCDTSGSPGLHGDNRGMGSNRRG